ncbi:MULTISPECIES: lambda exonuclease family protein [unclassified Caballeronia]|uniref:lambda exonuclease family protein n=1 Tax=unclassified Caballeronia TaxID=2646786 RepID=UPI001F402268|nr:MULTISPECIES: lambda exonuclease family protein [unclassified Caballeronia]MCE4544624.1 YqaJ viral recombinase family protein [Caballeronia sp. PC1]MCE4571776.1 YqaJ viral recombinase family protein [Caballeronia sp. CLC5]
MMSETIAQRTEDWRAARAGKITASRFGDAIAFTGGEPGDLYKSGAKKGQPKPRVPASSRTKYMRELVFERVALSATHEISGHALRYGTEVERFGKDAFELETGLILEDAPFVTHPQYPFIGCSPDALIGADGGYESKCPMDEGVHIETWLSGMPEEHIAQVQGCMFVTGRKWWEFVSFDPRMAPRFQLYHQRVPRDDAYINGVLLPGLLQFEKEVQHMIKQLEAKAA